MCDHRALGRVGDEIDLRSSFAPVRVAQVRVGLKVRRDVHSGQHFGHRVIRTVQVRKLLWAGSFADRAPGRHPEFAQFHRGLPRGLVGGGALPLAIGHDGQCTAVMESNDQRADQTRRIGRFTAVFRLHGQHVRARLEQGGDVEDVELFEIVPFADRLIVRLYLESVVGSHQQLGRLDRSISFDIERTTEELNPDRSLGRRVTLRIPNPAGLGRK